VVIEVRLYATLRRYAPAEAPAGVFSKVVAENTDLGGLLTVVGIKPEQVHLLMVNGTHAELDNVLHDGDRVGLFPPIGGG